MKNKLTFTNPNISSKKGDPMSTTKTLMTADELLKLHGDGFRYELIEGELKQMSPAGEKHGAAIGKLTGYLAYYVYENDLGIVCGAETGYKTRSNPDTVIAPDVSFTSKNRLKEEGLVDNYSTVAPDLVVEVISPDDYPKKVQRKVKAWLDFGVLVVITINPNKQAINVFRPNSNNITLTESDTLVLDDVVKGFSYPVAKLLLKQK